MSTVMIPKLDPQATLVGLAQKKPERVTLVVLSGDMDRVMAALIIATGAASMGMRVTMFFTFWGLNALTRRGSSRRATDWLRRMFGALSKGVADRLPLSR